MAFCTRSERKINLSIYENSKLGPGQYLQISKVPIENKYKYTRICSIHQVKPRNMQKLNSQTNVNKSSSCGANSTYNNSLANSISTKELSNNYGTVNVGCNFNSLNTNNNLNNVFISAEERFINRDEKYANPGPGEYININDNKGQETKIKRKKQQKLPCNFSTGLPSRVISIQSKSMNGYNFDENNKATIIMRPFPDEKSSTSPFVGPGTYNTSPAKTTTKVVKWFFAPKDKKAEIKKGIMNQILDYGNTISAEFKSTFCKGPYNFNYVINEKMKHDNLGKDLTKIKGVSKLEKMIGEVPGPGFYDQEFSYDPITKLEKDKALLEDRKIPHVYTSLEGQGRGFQKDKKDIGKEKEISRDHYLLKSNSCSSLGPGSYFLTKNKFQPGLKEQNMLDKNALIKYNPDTKGITVSVSNTFFNYRTDSFNTCTVFKQKGENKNYSPTNNFIDDMINRNPDVGPGSYNLSGDIQKESFNSKGTFANSKKASFSCEVSSTPGPGSYISAGSDTNTKETQRIKKFLRKNIHKIIKKKGDSFVKVNDNPGVGSYNPEIVSTIEYNNYKKINNKTRSREAFSNSSSRFAMAKIEENLGPASYDPRRIEGNYGKKYLSPFGVDSKKLTSRDKDYNVGPGQYNVYPGWNKKTFNMLFFAK